MIQEVVWACTPAKIGFLSGSHAANLTNNGICSLQEHCDMVYLSFRSHRSDAEAWDLTSHLLGDKFTSTSRSGIRLWANLMMSHVTDVFSLQHRFHHHPFHHQQWRLLRRRLQQQPQQRRRPWPHITPHRSALSHKEQEGIDSVAKGLSESADVMKRWDQGKERHDQRKETCDERKKDWDSRTVLFYATALIITLIWSSATWRLLKLTIPEIPHIIIYFLFNMEL